MAASIPVLSLEANEWLDVNTVSGIAVGSDFVLQNIGDYIVELVKKDTEPETGDGFNFLNPVDEYGSWLQVQADDPRIWLRCKNKTRVSAQL